MPPPSSTVPSVTACGDEAAVATPITAAIHRDIIQTHILNRLDGPTLASTSCASSEMLSLCSDDHLWRDICTATWPSTADPCVSSAISSFPSGHRSFYSDSFPTPRSTALKTQKAARVSHPSEVGQSELISAVDIFYGEELIYSKVLFTETQSPWFLSTPFRLDLLEPKEIVRPPLKLEAGDLDGDDGHERRRLRLSWILINPSTKRAVNVASREALEANRHWLNTDEVQFRYATAMGPTEGDGGGPVLCSVLVTCGGGGEDGHARVREVSLQMEDMDGKIVPGRDSLVILNKAMEGQRCKSTDGSMERDTYGIFLKTRMEYRERKLRRENRLDMACVAMGILIFLAVFLLFLRR